MDRGREFLQSQVNNCVMQHQTFLRNLEDHEKQAEDARFRDLCSRYIPPMREHQRMIEAYAQSIGAELGVGKKALGAALGLARNAADLARESDFLRLVGDIVTARQSQDTFTTFARVGSRIGEPRLAELGEMMSGPHKQYVDEANALVADMFVDHVNGTEAARSTSGAGAPAASY
jgi:hypothetical protein